LPSWYWIMLKAPQVQAPSLSWLPPWAPSHCPQQPTLNPHQENMLYWLHNRAHRSIKWHFVKNQETRVKYCYFQEIMCQWHANFQMLLFKRSTMYTFFMWTQQQEVHGKFHYSKQVSIFFLRESIASMAERNTHV
jgi:hypothetical protein